MNKILLALLLTGCVSQKEDLFEPAEKRLVWSQQQIPLGVKVDLPQFESDVVAAGVDLNDRVGCQILRFVNEEALITVDSPGFEVGEKWVDEMTYATGLRTSIQTAEVRLSALTTPTAAYLLSYHGFGHALGLAHDERSRSIMMPNIGDWEANNSGLSTPGMIPSFRNYPWQPALPPHLNDRHAGALRDMYCAVKR